MKLREAVAKHIFRSATLHCVVNMRIHNLRKYKYSPGRLIKSKFYKFIMNLDRMFLKKSMGMRLKEINTNMFVNQFMTNVLREQPKFETRNIMREYFRVND